MMLSISEGLSPDIELSGLAFWGRRNAENDSEIDVVFPSQTQQDLSSENYGAVLGSDVWLPGDWRLSSGVGISRVTESTSTTTNFPTFGLEFATGFATQNVLSSADTKVDGPLFALPGGDVRAALFAEYRKQEYQILDQTTDGLPFAPDAGVNRESLGVAAELFVPIVGDDNAQPWLRRLALSVAGRYDKYSDFGATVNPRIGLLWSPADGLTLRGTWSTAFHTPPLNLLLHDEVYIVSALPDPSAPDGVTVTLVDTSFGTLPLKPETAETLAVGADWTPSFERDLHLRLNYYRIAYDQRISAPPYPGQDFFNIYQPGGELLQFLVNRAPSLAVVNALYACASCRLLGGDIFAPNEIEAILDGRQRNLSSTKQDGIDAKLSYTLESELGDYSVSLLTSYVLHNDYSVQLGAPSIDIRNRFALPVALRVVGGLGWHYEDFSANATVNFVDGYSNDRFLPSEKIVPWTTVDLALSYQFHDSQSLLGGISLSLTVQNIADEAPPFVRPRFDTEITYDPANASGIGRFIALQLRKEW